MKKTNNITVTDMQTKDSGRVPFDMLPALVVNPIIFSPTPKVNADKAKDKENDVQYGRCFR